MRTSKDFIYGHAKCSRAQHNGSDVASEIQRRRYARYYSGLSADDQPIAYDFHGPWREAGWVVVVCELQCPVSHLRPSHLWIQSEYLAETNLKTGIWNPNLVYAPGRSSQWDRTAGRNFYTTRSSNPPYEQETTRVLKWEASRIAIVGNGSWVHARPELAPWARTAGLSSTSDTEYSLPDFDWPCTRTCFRMARNVRPPSSTVVYEDRCVPCDHIVRVGGGDGEVAHLGRTDEVVDGDHQLKLAVRAGDDGLAGYQVCGVDPTGGGGVPERMVLGRS
jgi:hypothetical protein